MKLAFGIWDHFERRPEIPITDQYQQKINLVREAERLGFSRYHLAEHHLSPLDLAPSPNVFLAALAQATQHLRLGAMVYILPLYHPLAGITRHLVVRDTDAQAEAVARRAWPAFQRNWHATSLRPPGGRVARHNEDFDSVLAENTRLLVGSPRTIVRYLDACLERLATRPSFYFAPAVQWGDLTYQASLETLQLFADQVMPTFAGLLHTS